MTAKELQNRACRFAIDVIKLVRALPVRLDANRVGSQLLSAATSVAANYRAACRARSRAEFAAKLGVVVEEADESLFWLELLVGAEIVSEQQVASLIKEADELTAIFVRSRITVTGRR